MRTLLALLVGLAVSGCSADATAPEPPQTLEQATSGSAPSPGVSAAAPTVPYLLKGRLHVGREVLPGRYAGLVVRGTTWLAGESGDGPSAWGTDTTAHPLSARTSAKLSPNGRYLATVTGGEHCEGVGLNLEGRPCTIGLVDTSAAEPDQRLRVGRTVVLVGVTDDGVVMLTEGAARRWDQLAWDAAGGADAVRPLVDSPQMREWAMQGWEAAGFGHAGLELHTGNVPRRWLGEIVGGAVRPRFQIPEDVEPGPGGAWVVATSWWDRGWRHDLKGAFEPTTPTLRVRTLGDRGRLGPPVPLHAPTGWYFARATPADDVVFWEDADTFVARVVDSRQSGARVARCDLPLASCVLVGS